MKKTNTNNNSRRRSNGDGTYHFDAKSIIKSCLVNPFTWRVFSYVCVCICNMMVIMSLFLCFWDLFFSWFFFRFLYSMRCEFIFMGICTNLRYKRNGISTSTVFTFSCAVCSFVIALDKKKRTYYVNVFLTSSFLDGKVASIQLCMITVFS